MRLLAALALVLFAPVVAAPAAQGAPGTPSTYDDRVARVRHASAALGVERSFHIYVPPEASEPGRRFPTVYLFRGHFREWVNTTEDASRGGRNVVDVYEALRAEGAIEPLILVFPGVTAENADIHSAGVNMRALGGNASIGTGRFEDYVVDDLIPFVDANYPTIADRGARGVDGYSLGGFVSVKLALQYPELFHTVGAVDAPYFLPKKRKPGVVATKKDAIFRDPYFDAAFGVPRSATFAGANNALTLLSTVDASVVPSLKWLIEYGPAGPSSNFDRGERLVRLIEAKGGENLMQGAVPGFLHDWRHADEHMRRAFVLHSQLLAGPPE
jgi:S-formylglutathione hydrolase FrmB